MRRKLRANLRRLRQGPSGETATLACAAASSGSASWPATLYPSHSAPADTLCSFTTWAGSKKTRERRLSSAVGLNSTMSLSLESSSSGTMHARGTCTVLKVVLV